MNTITLKKQFTTRRVVLNMMGIMFFTYSFAQTEAVSAPCKYTLGVFGGLNIPQLSSGGSSNPLSDGYTSRLGEAFGLTSSYACGSGLSIVADALFSSEGGKKNGQQAIDASSVNPQAPNGTYMYANYNSESILNYIEIPIMARYTATIVKSFKFYIDFGPYIGFLTTAKQKTSGTSLIYIDQGETQPVVPVAQSFNATTDVTNSLNPLVFGLTGGIGCSQKAGTGDIFLDLRGAYGLTTVQQSSVDGTSHSGYLSITVGYLLPL